jgi:hypothetical protein
MAATAVGVRSLARASLRLLIATGDSGVPGSGLVPSNVSASRGLLQPLPPAVSLDWSDN